MSTDYIKPTKGKDIITKYDIILEFVLAKYSCLCSEINHQRLDLLSTIFSNFFVTKFPLLDLQLMRSNILACVKPKSIGYTIG